MPADKPPIANLIGGPRRQKKGDLDEAGRKERDSKNNAARQARFREKRKQETALFVPGEACTVMVSFSATESAHLEKAMKIRAIWSTSNYSLQDYITTMLLHDADRLNRELKALRDKPCENCGRIPPEHCGGTFKGQADCWLTRGALELNL
jgi:hypothetical protein